VDSFGIGPETDSYQIIAQIEGCANPCQSAMMCKIGKLSFVAGPEIPKRYLPADGNRG
jgi:hypothetical protein